MRARTRCLGWLSASLLAIPGAVGAQPQQARQGWWNGVSGPELQAAPGEPADRQADAAFVPAGQVAPLDAATLAGFECVEVRRFETRRGGGFISGKEAARASAISEARLQDLQRAVAGQVAEKTGRLRATLVGPGWPSCPDPARALVLGGDLVDYKAGNQALRYFVGFGAGAQKFSVEVWVARKSDGALLAREEVVDRKVGGWLGGQADKGVEDFAEKVGRLVDRVTR